MKQSSTGPTRRGARTSETDALQIRSSTAMSSGDRVDTLIVFGGTGFVGSAVLEAALSSHVSLQVVIMTRTGKPPAYYRDDPILKSNRLHFCSGDLVNQSLSELQQVLEPWTSDPRTRFIGCISCVGCITPWNQQNMVVTCGDANVAAYKICRTLSATKFVVMTRDRTNWSDWWYPFPYIMPGYYEGKRKIENFISNDAQNRGNAVCLRAGFVSGTRRTIPGLSTQVFPWLRVPMECPCRVVQLVCPTIPVEELAGAAGRFVLSKRKSKTAIVENEQIPSFFR